MKTKIILLSMMVLCLASCTVTNNLYVNDPIPKAKKEHHFYTGISTGLEPKISQSSEGNINFNDGLRLAPVLSAGIQGGIWRNLNYRASLHLPYVVGGIGLRGGIQQSFFNKDSKINMATGIDMGFVITKDSLWGSSLDAATNGAIHLDLFLPVSYSFSENYKIILTPRMSSNIMYVKYHIESDDTRKFKPILPVLTLGLMLNKLYLEGSAVYYNEKIIPQFGLAFRSPINVESE